MLALPARFWVVAAVLVRIILICSALGTGIPHLGSNDVQFGWLKLEATKSRSKVKHYKNIETMHIALNTHDRVLIYKIMEYELRLARIGTQAFASLA
jgi:hypothetical protein